MSLIDELAGRANNIYSAERHSAKVGTVERFCVHWRGTSGGNYYAWLAFVLALAP